MPTIYDVAKRAGVSTFTVSAVLNKSAYVSPQLTARVQKAVQELNYTINELARGLQTRKTQTVGMLIPDISSPYYAKVVRGADDVLKAAGYSLILGNSYNQAEEQSRYLQVFRAKQVDGLLLFISPGDDAALRVLLDSRKPVVFVSRVPAGLKADSVTADSVKGTRLAVEHLIANGRRRIALVNGQAGLSPGAERLEGWKTALQDAGIGPDLRLTGYGNWTAEAGHDLAVRFLDMPERPTAMFVANFLMMTGVLRAIQERGLRCPEDVEVISSDDSEWLDVFRPRISTVAQPSYGMGSTAAELLLKRLRNPRRRCEHVVLEPHLIIRK